MNNIQIQMTETVTVETDDDTIVFCTGEIYDATPILVPLPKDNKTSCGIVFLLELEGNNFHVGANVCRPVIEKAIPLHGWSPAKEEDDDGEKNGCWLKPINFEEADRDMQPPGDWDEEKRGKCMPLPVLRTASGFLSCWELKNKEAREHFLSHGRVWIHVAGEMQPPLSLSCQRDWFIPQPRLGGKEEES